MPVGILISTGILNFIICKFDLLGKHYQIIKLSNCHIIKFKKSYCATQPPSTGIATPVTKEAASEHNQITAAATSSGCPNHPMGSWEANAFSTSLFFPVKRSIIGV